MSDDEVQIEWVGGAWDGRTLTVPRHTALGLLGKYLHCPSHGAPFMVLAELPAGEGRIVSYQADLELSNNQVLYLRSLVPSPHC